MIVLNMHKAPGRFANKLFVYIFGCMLALLSGQGISDYHPDVFLSTGGIKALLPDEIKNNPIVNHHKSIQIDHTNCGELFYNIDKYKQHNLVLNTSYYQRSEFYTQLPEHKQFIKQCLDIPSSMGQTTNYRDIVIHLRLDDFNHHGHNSMINDYSWYENILQNETFDKLYIVYDRNPTTKFANLHPTIRSQERKYIAQFSKYNPIIINRSMLEDMQFIASFDKIVCSASTYCWFAMFFSNASTIYFPMDKSNELIASMSHLKASVPKKIDILKL